MRPGVLERRDITVDGMRIAYFVKGSSGPVTLYLHGLGADAASTRPLASGVPGRGVLVDLPSHGHSADAPEALAYDDLVQIARNVAAAEGATQALGVSLGSAILLRWLISRPQELDRAVLYLPAAVRQPRPAGRLRAALADPSALREYVACELPHDVARTTLGARWLTERQTALQRAGIAAYARMLESHAPVPDASVAAAVRTRLLAIGAEHDRLHPVQAATEAAETFPNGRAHIFAEAAPLWTSRRELRRTIASFLGGFDTVGE